MKKIIIYSFLLLAFLYSNHVYADINPKFIKMGWSFVSPIILKEVKEPLARKIISISVPKLIDKDFKGAAFEICQVVSVEKNIKVLNKEYLKILEVDLTETYKFIKKKEFENVANNLMMIYSYTDKYLKTGKMQLENDKSNLKSESDNARIINREIIQKKVFFSEDDSYFFFSGENEMLNKKNVPSKSKSTISNNEFIFKNKENKSFSIDIQVDSSEIGAISFYKNNNDEFNKLSKRFDDQLNRKGTYNLISKDYEEHANFNSIKFQYRFSKDTVSGMSLVNIMYYNSRVFCIKFESTDEDYQSTLKSYNEFLQNIYIDEVDKVNDSKSFSKLIIKSITVDKMPWKDKNGETWDYPAGNLLPDVYYTITNDRDESIYKLDVQFRKENLTKEELPFTFKTIEKNIVINDLSSSFTIRLRDFDSLDDPDYIGGFIFKIKHFMTGSNSFPNVLTLENEELKISVNVLWE